MLQVPSRRQAETQIWGGGGSGSHLSLEPHLPRQSRCSDKITFHGQATSRTGSGRRLAYLSCLGLGSATIYHSLPQRAWSRLKLSATERIFTCCTCCHVATPGPCSSRPSLSLQLADVNCKATCQDQKQLSPAASNKPFPHHSVKALQPTWKRKCRSNLFACMPSTL